MVLINTGTMPNLYYAALDAAMRGFEGFAEALPFAPSSFDTVLCQFGLKFFDDRAKALNEMVRVHAMRSNACRCRIPP